MHHDNTKEAEACIFVMSSEAPRAEVVVYNPSEVFARGRRVEDPEAALAGLRSDEALLLINNEEKHAGTRGGFVQSVKVVASFYSHAPWFMAHEELFALFTSIKTCGITFSFVPVGKNWANTNKWETVKLWEPRIATIMMREARLSHDDAEWWIVDSKLEKKSAEE